MTVFYGENIKLTKMVPGKFKHLCYSFFHAARYRKQVRAKDF